MRKLLFLLALLAPLKAQAQPVTMPPGPPITCNQEVVYDTNTNGATKLITGVAGKQIYICGYNLMASGTVTATLEYGTGTNCGTGTTKMTPGYPLVAQAHVEDQGSFVRGLIVPASTDFCVLTNAAVAVQLVVYYGIY